LKILTASSLKLSPNATELNFEHALGEIGIINDMANNYNLIRVLFREMAPAEGEVHYNSEILDDTKRDWKTQLGYSYRENGLISNLSVYENLELPVVYHSFDEGIITKPLIELEIDEKFWNLRPHQLPANIKKKVLIARSIVLGPKLLILNQPSSLLNRDDLLCLTKCLMRLKNNGVGILIFTDNTYLSQIWGDWFLDPITNRRNDNVDEIFSHEQREISQLMKVDLTIEGI
jgi:ABC-type ATPase involved in cell division